MNINQIIDTLCEKLNIAWGEASKLVPEIIAWGKVKSGIGIAITMCVLIACIVTIVWVLKVCAKRRKTSGSNYGLMEYLEVGNDVTPHFIIAIMVLLIDIIIMLFSISDWIQWFVAPNMAVIKYITELM